MLEKSKHYSNKGGHLERSLVNKILERAMREGLPLCKSDISFCLEREINREPNNQENSR
jgi:hypothetical protein